MAVAKHTPPPWVAKPSTFIPGAWSVASRTGSAAGEPLHVHLLPDGKVVGHDVEPDARLIAAAPDLLAELEETAVWLDGQIETLTSTLLDVPAKLKDVRERLRRQAAFLRGRAAVIRTVALKAKGGA